MSEKPIARRSLLPTKKEAVVAVAPANKQQRHTFNVEIENDVLILRLPMVPAEQRKVSKSGKSIICAGTGGTKVARQIVADASIPVEINGKAMRVCATAWIGCDKSDALASGTEETFEEGVDNNG